MSSEIGEQRRKSTTQGFRIGANLAEHAKPCPNGLQDEKAVSQKFIGMAVEFVSTDKPDRHDYPADESNNAIANA